MIDKNNNQNNDHNNNKNIDKDNQNNDHNNTDEQIIIMNTRIVNKNI